MTATETKKWTADASLGKIQAKRFNEAVSKFNWDAKTIKEITDFGEHLVTPMFTGPVNPGARPLMAEIEERYNWTVTAKNYMQIVGDILAATVKLAETRHVEDRRTTPEERAERDAARLEREQKAAIEAARIAGMKTHTYDTVEAAKELKRVLGIIWPTVEFSVTSKRYSGGYSITPSWTDGPTGQQVRAITGWFGNKDFDGMQDLETDVNPREWNGHRFDIRGGYVHGARSVSAELLHQCAERFQNETGLMGPSINATDPNYPYLERNGTTCGWSLHVHDTEHPEGVLCRDECSNWTAADLVGQMSHHVATVEPAHPLDRETIYRILLGEITGNKPEDLTSSLSESGQTAEGVTVTENEAKDGVEIRFPDKPSSAILDDLKANGWRWSRFSKCWYAKRSPATLTFANNLAGGGQ